MTYSLYDYAIVLRAAGLKPIQIRSVLYANGESDGDEWSGSFVVQCFDGSLALIEGEVTGAYPFGYSTTQTYYFTREDLLEIHPEVEGWDEDPVDLNLWHERGCPDEDLE